MQIQNRLWEIAEAEFNIWPVPPGPTELQCYEVVFNEVNPHEGDDNRNLPPIVWNELYKY